MGGISMRTLVASIYLKGSKPVKLKGDELNLSMGFRTRLNPYYIARGCNNSSNCVKHFRKLISITFSRRAIYTSEKA